jgi:parallel beta-helix repeat protein
MLMTGTNGKYKNVDDYNSSSLIKGYSGFKNITVIGGTFIGSNTNEGSIIRMFHATNITLNGVTLKGGACAHQMEVCAINKFYVKNCSFMDNGKSADDTDNFEKQEALQMDIPVSDKVFPHAYLDGTPMKNVEITGCTFKNVARGVGSHTLLLGAYHENIKINNNTFDNVLEESIITLNYDNCEIKNNTIKNCGGGIVVQNFKSTPQSMVTTCFNGKTKFKGTFRYNMHTVISDNNIKLKYAPTCDYGNGITVYGYNQLKDEKGGDGKTIPAGNYYISGITITKNTITTAGHGIRLTCARNCTVKNNVVKGKGFSNKDPEKEKYDGVLVEHYSKNITVQNNKLSNMTRDGIFVQDQSSVKGLSNNKITGCNQRGIAFYDRSQCTGAIKNNIIKKCNGGGILVSTDTTTKAISYNTITSCAGDSGITVYNGSKTGSINHNTITNLGKTEAKEYCMGIKLSLNAKTTSISYNTITNTTGKYSSQKGIILYNGSTVTGTIDNNKIYNTSDSSIAISEKSVVGGNIEKNTIKKSGHNGIEIIKSSTVKKAVKKNNLSKIKGKAIQILTGGKVKKGVSKNKIK